MEKYDTAKTELQALIETAKEQSGRKDPAALQTWIQAAEASKQLVGATHSWTVFCINNVGKTLVDKGEYERAIPLLESSLGAAHAAFGQVHFCVEHASQSLGRAYGALGDQAKAAQHWDAAALSSEIIRGPCHQTTIFCLSQKGRALMRQNRPVEALPILRKVLGRTQSLHGRHFHTGYAARELAACLNQIGNFKDAIPLWKYARRCFSIDQEKYSRQILNAAHCLEWAERHLSGNQEAPACSEEIAAAAFIVADAVTRPSDE